MKRLLVILVAVGCLAAKPGWAVFGVGDLSFDPTTYAEVAKLYEQARELYKTAKQQLDTMAEIQRTMKEAQQAYEDLVNTDLNALAEDLKPGKYYNRDSGDRINALRVELARLEANGERASNYYEYQLNRLTNLERLQRLQELSSRNAQAASTDVDTRKSGQITAQSTAALAALASAEEERRQREDLERAAARKNERDAFFASQRIYESMGK